ncbi:MAG TPA: DUF4870 domain-containing protein [Ignavibacteria bacterium]|nr:DUF4870 domain-containing protein [Ignavibacteria bacterium]HMQ99256.1 DUF4870 domain-containing protein [Ignavibacteria bacterium]
MDQLTEQGYITQQSSVTQNEKLLAMFAHLSMFFGSLWVPLIFWAINKDKSKFVSFHSLQSLFFHIAYTVVLVVLVMFVAVIGMAAGLIVPGQDGPSHIGALQIIVLLAIAVVVLGFIFASVALAIINAVSAYKGGMKKYPIIGNMVYRRVYGVN